MNTFFKKNWVEMLIVPPILVGCCYFLYGKTYFDSWGNFWAKTLPWVIYGAIVSSACKWWRRLMHARFQRMEDWWKRLVYSLLGYFSAHAVLISCYLFISKKMPDWDLIPTEERLYIIMVANFLTLIIITTFYEGITFFEKWRAAVVESEQLEKLNFESQFRSLQSQLNPHFLFNSLNVLSSLIAENPRRAEDFVDELSNVYRYLLRSNEQELATVADEIRFIRSFFHLLQTRHGSAGIELKIDLAPAILPKKLPALVLQVLVENAVKHNETSPEKPLLIEIFQKNEHQIVVRNNMQAKQTRVVSNRVGLSNLEERYKLLGIAGFEIRANDDQFFEVVLPLI